MIQIHQANEVTINTLTANVVCPWHGELPFEQDYTAGRAQCGCEFQRLPGGRLRAVRAAAEPAAQVSGDGDGQAT